MHREERPIAAGAGSADAHGVAQVAVVGLGLMGGSLGLALKRYVPGVEVVGYARRAETRQLALAMQACDRVTDDVLGAVQDADVVVLCTPILEIPPLVERIRDHLRAGAIVTDVGSTKAYLVEQVGQLLEGMDACFVGSHPMAGSEHSGISSAQADLYVNATVLVTPPESPESPAAQTLRIARLWRDLGARVLVLGADTHDQIVAGTSHVPHLLAALLVRAAARVAPDCGPYCGSGFRDTTRIAAGSEWVWHDIVKTNATSISAALEGVRADIDGLLAALQSEDFDGVRALLGEARAQRARIMEKSEESGSGAS